MQKSGSRAASRNAFFLSSQTADFRNDPSGFRQLLSANIHRQVTFESASQHFATNSTGRLPTDCFPHYFLWEDLTAWWLTRLVVSPHGGQPTWWLITNQLTTLAACVTNECLKNNIIFETMSSGTRNKTTMQVQNSATPPLNTQYSTI